MVQGSELLWPAPFPRPTSSGGENVAPNTLLQESTRDKTGGGLQKFITNFTYIHTCVYIYIHTDTYTYINTHLLSQPCVLAVLQAQHLQAAALRHHTKPRPSILILRPRLHQPGRQLRRLFHLRKTQLLLPQRKTQTANWVKAKAAKRVQTPQYGRKV